MMWVNLVAVPLLARLCVVGMFPFSAADKIFYWKDALQQANSSFLPGGPVLLALGIVIETLTPLCILLGWHDRIAAFVLAGFCVVTALLYHPFWQFPKFWSPVQPVGRAHYWDFLKNLGLAGGLLLVVVAGPPVPLFAVLQHPLGSTVYAAPVTGGP